MFQCILVGLLITCAHGEYALNKSPMGCSIQYRAKGDWFATTAFRAGTIDGCDEEWAKLKAKLLKEN